MSGKQQKTSILEESEEARETRRAILEVAREELACTHAGLERIARRNESVEERLRRAAAYLVGAAQPATADVIFSRAQRAHSRLCWAERLARNARSATVGRVTIKLLGVPEGLASLLGLVTA